MEFDTRAAFDDAHGACARLRYARERFADARHAQPAARCAAQAIARAERVRDITQRARAAARARCAPRCRLRCLLFTILFSLLFMLALMILPPLMPLLPYFTISSATLHAADDMAAEDIDDTLERA